MSTIRVVWGSATGPTPTASYDAALADANVHNYNLITVSSVVPADPAVERVGTAPDLGPTGNALTVVQSRETVPPGSDDPAVAGVGWLRSRSGRGLFYEAAGRDRIAVRERIRDGLAAGTDLREWTFEDDATIQLETTAPSPDEHSTAVVVAAYGRSRSLFAGDEP
jgi:arginine decarboxylase